MNGFMSTAEALTIVKQRDGGGLQMDCNYGNYMKTLDAAHKSTRTFQKDMKNRDKAKGRWGILPTGDMVDMVLHFGTVVAQGAILRQSQLSIPDMVQQMCVTSVSQDQVQRQVSLSREARIGADKSINSSAAFFTVQSVSNSLERQSISANWKGYYTEVTPVQGIAGDSLWREADAQMQAVQSQLEAFSRRERELNGMLEAAKRFVFVAADSSGRCPGAVDDPTAISTNPLGSGGVPGARRRTGEECLAPPERADQATAWLELIGADTERMIMLVKARQLQLNTLELSTMSVVRRQQRLTQVKGTINY